VEPNEGGGESKGGEEDNEDSWVSERIRSPRDSDNEANSEEQFPQYNPEAKFGNVSLELGMEFATMEAFKQGMRDYTIQKGREIKWVRNEKHRARARCKQEDCD